MWSGYDELVKKFSPMLLSTWENAPRRCLSDIIVEKDPDFVQLLSQIIYGFGVKDHLFAL
jgi:hypothetical protein